MGFLSCVCAEGVKLAGERTLISCDCSSVQKGPNMRAEDGILIRKGTADCMCRFIEAAQDSRARLAGWVDLVCFVQPKNQTNQITVFLRWRTFSTAC
jgi:hypothetical protein